MRKNSEAYPVTLRLKASKTKIVEFANSVDQDEVAHYLIWIFTVSPRFFELSVRYNVDKIIFESLQS